MPRVSVIMASYNHGRFVARAVQSVLDQTFQGFELVVTDDASSDDTAEVIGSFEDARIDLERLARNRQDSARNRSLERASGEYVAILNSDDEFHPRKLERQVSWLDEQPETGAVFSRVRMIDEQGDDYPDSEHPYLRAFSSRNRTRFEWLRRFFERGNSLCITSAMVRRDLLDEVGRFDPLLGQLADLDLWIRVCLRAEIHILPERLTSMRLLAGERNASGRRPATLRRSTYEQFRLMSHFRSPIAVSQLRSIFPEFDHGDGDRSEADLLYDLARHSMSLRTPAHQLFGLELMRSLLEDPRQREEIANQESSAPIAEFLESAGRVGPLTSVGASCIELYWPLAGEYAEGRRSTDELLHGERGWVRLSCPAGVETSHPLRLDPGDRPSIVSIHSLLVRDSDTGEVLAEVGVGELRRTAIVRGTACPLRSTSAFRLLSTGVDPQLLLPIPRLPEGRSLAIEIDLEVDPELRDLQELQGRIAPGYTMRQAIRLRASLVKRWLKRRIALISPSVIQR